MTIFSVPDKSSVFTVSVRAYSVLQFSFTHKYMVQCTNSCVVATNCKLFVVYVFLILFYFILFFFGVRILVQDHENIEAIYYC